MSQPAQEDEEEKTEDTPEYDTIIDDDMAATAEPVNVEVIELQMSGDDELVDEPTREIIINTHHWNKIKSEMREDDPMIPEHDAQIEYKEEYIPEAAEEQIPEAAEEQEMVETVENRRQYLKRQISERLYRRILNRKPGRTEYLSRWN